MVGCPDHIGWVAADIHFRRQYGPDLPRIGPWSEIIVFVPDIKYGYMLTIRDPETNEPDKRIVPFFHPSYLFLEGQGEAPAAEAWSYLSSMGSNPLKEEYRAPDWGGMPEEVRMVSNRVFKRHEIMRYYDHWEDMRTELDRIEADRNELRGLMKSIRSE